MKQSVNVQSVRSKKNDAASSQVDCVSDGSLFLRASLRLRAVAREAALRSLIEHMVMAR